MTIASNTGSVMSQNTPLSEASIQSWLVSQVSDRLGVSPDEIDKQARLDSFGLDSAQALGMMSEAENLVGFQVSPALLWHYPTIELLSERLAEDCAEDDSELFEL